MTSDPLAEEAVGHLNIQSVTVTAQTQMDLITKPEAKSKLTEAIGDRGSKRRLEGPMVA